MLFHQNQPSRIDLVIYHRGCSDGQAAAAVAHRVLGDTPKYMAVNAGAKDAPDVKGKGVLVLDTSFTEEQTLQMIADAAFFLVIDHHKTAEAALANVPNANKMFDMTKCGATLTWEYFYGPDADVPLFLQYIQDRDIWAQKLPYCNEMWELYHAYPKDSFDRFNELISSDEETQKLVVSAASIKEYKDANVDAIVNKANIHVISVNGELRVVAYYNTPIYVDEAGHRILARHPCVDFSCNYKHNTGHEETYLSFRSEDSRLDVSELAQRLGGGGHRNAAGAKLDGLHCRLPFKHVDIDLVFEINRAPREEIEWNDGSYTAVRVPMNKYTFNFNKDMITLLKQKFPDIEGILYVKDADTFFFLNFETESLNTRV